MKGRHVFMGYLNMEDKTREALDDKGYLHSGDIGRKDANGFLFITGRIKGIDILKYFKVWALHTIFLFFLL